MKRIIRRVAKCGFSRGEACGAMTNKEVGTMQARPAGLRRLGRVTGRMLAFAVLAILSLAGFAGGASAQPLSYHIECGVGPPSWEALHPSGLYFTYGPGIFGRDITSPAPPYAAMPGALTIIGDSSWKLSRWMTQTTAIGCGDVHGGGFVDVMASMRTLNVPGYANISLTYWDKDVQYIGSASSSNLKGTTDWTPMSVSGVTPEGTKYIRIEYLLSGPGEVWIGGTLFGFDYAWITYPEAPIVNLTPPSVVGLAQVGQLLHANIGTWSNTGMGAPHFKWYRCNAAGQNCVLIPDAGDQGVPNGPDPPGQYTVRPDDVGSTLQVAVKLASEQPSDFVMSAPTAVVTSAGGQQLAPDPGFEVDPGPFYFTDGPCGFSWASDQAHSATHALKIYTTTSTPCRWMSETRAISATPGTSYNVSAWLKTLGTASVTRLSVNFWDRAETYIPATVDAPVSIHGPQDWTQLSLRVTAPANAAFLRVEFRLNGPGTLWVDDVAVTH
jgi:hypothetical protein